MSDQAPAPVQTKQPDGVQSATVGQNVGFSPASGAQMIPIAQYVPAFANVTPVDPYNGIPADISGIINAAHTMQIRQHVKLLPKNCFTCPPCVKQENTYSVYAGFEESDSNEFLRVDEVSDDWNRCCCAPYHPFKLEVRQYIPPPDATTNASDWQHLKGDVVNDWKKLKPNEKADKMKDHYANYPPLFTIERTDGMRCCCKCPFQWLNTCVCASFCQDGARVYAGPIAEVPEVEKGRPVPGTQNYLMGSIIQPVFGGWIKPELHLFNEGQDGTSEPYGRIEGPCFFGGWSEMCCSFKFFTSFFNSPSKTGDIAIITKKKPSSIAGAMKELFSDNADNYSIEYNPQAELSIGQKTTVLAAQLLADYMWFDGNTEKCHIDRNGCTCYLCYCSLVGLLVPCYIHVPRGDSSGGD